MKGRAFGGPGIYIQRSGEIDKLGTHTAKLGNRIFALVDEFVLDTLGERIAGGLRNVEGDVVIERFHGECWTGEIERVTDLARQANADCICGIGGGKTIDTAKLAAIALDARITIVPTIASTDAPCSAIAVRYSQSGTYEEAVRLPRNPDCVIVDSKIVAEAPARFFVAGIGDALSTWFEARANLDARCDNLVGGGFPPTSAGIAIARACHDILRRDSEAAVRAIECDAITPAVEAIIEANTLLSGLGFENCGVSAAHGIHDGLTVLEPTSRFYHGEKVAFGVLCLLMLEGRPLAEIQETAMFCRLLGLPTTLTDLGLAGASKDDIGKVAAAALLPNSPTYNVSVPLSEDILRDAILSLDAFTTTLS